MDVIFGPAPPAPQVVPLDYDEFDRVLIELGLVDATDAWTQDAVIAVFGYELGPPRGAGADREARRRREDDDRQDPRLEGEELAARRAVDRLLGKRAAGKVNHDTWSDEVFGPALEGPA